MVGLKRCVFLPALMCFMFVGVLHAEERVKSKIEQSIPIPKSKTDLSTHRRSRLTEEQAVNQLKYMMVKGWAHMEKGLVKNKTFKPFGMVLSPEGEFKALVVDGGKEEKNVPTEIRLAAVAKNLKAIANTRSMWGVGLMYIQKQQRRDGTYDARIMVMTEHIAGWGRHWSYPFKVVKGEVKLGAPIVTPVKPFYFAVQKH